MAGKLKSQEENTEALHQRSNCGKRVPLGWIRTKGAGWDSTRLKRIGRGSTLAGAGALTCCNEPGFLSVGETAK